MSKVALARYGDKVIIGGDGSFGGLGGGSVSLSDLSDEQLAALEQLASLRLPADEPQVVEPDPETSRGWGEASDFLSKEAGASRKVPYSQRFPRNVPATSPAFPHLGHSAAAASRPRPSRARSRG